MTDSAHYWLVTVAELEDTGREPVLLRTYTATVDEVEAVTALLGNPIETALMDEATRAKAAEAFQTAVVHD